jgi:3',5'-nucleoside bisphosphate phosphatase
MFADLHLHTYFSDGTYSPEELVAQAKIAHLHAISLTDHDTMEGCPRTAAACQAAGLEFIPACEFTAEMNNIEVHLLGYFLDPENQKLKTELAKFQEVRQRRIETIAERLNGLGIPLRAETVFELAKCRAPGRPHVARALVQEEFCGSLDEAFERFLKKGKPAWAPKFKISAMDAIELIHQAGGLAVLAHPGLSRADQAIPQIIKGGLDGLECFHTKHSTYMTEHYVQLCEQRGLLVTGGSDCHGLNHGRPLIGTIRIPYSLVDKMKDRLLQRALNAGFMLANKPKGEVPASNPIPS